MGVESQRIEEYRLTEEPYYLPLGNEVELFEAAYNAKLPVMLKGPTGCGKTRFVEHMSWRLGRTLVTVACHEDLTSSDLIGKYTLRNDETVWQDGPLTTAVKAGGIAYLDEIVEARKDTTVVIHPLTDDRRILPLEKKGEIVESIQLAARKPKSGDAYLRFIPRTEMDIAVVGCGTSVTLDASGKITAARVSLGAVAARPLLVKEAADAIIGTTLDDAALAKLDAAAQAACKPINDKRGTVEYRTKVAGVLARRTAQTAYDRAKG